MPPSPTRRPFLAKKPAPEPQNHKTFDSWNSASTGHQRAGCLYAGSSSWKDTRSLKLGQQLQTGDCLRPDDRRSAGQAQAFDGKCGTQSFEGGEGEKENRQISVNGDGEWRWVTDAQAKRSQLGVRDIRSFMGVSKRKAVDDEQLQSGFFVEKKLRKEARPAIAKPGSGSESRKTKLNELPDSTAPVVSPEEPRNPSTYSTKADSQQGFSHTVAPVSTSNIFSGTTVFVNGSTMPWVSDHKLKHLLVSHGAKVSISMARKTVSHIIIGQPNTGDGPGLGAGGGLSARKLQQEIARGGWKGVKVVGVDWVLESINAGKRLAESRFAGMHVAQKGQRSVAGMFGGH